MRKDPFNIQEDVVFYDVTTFCFKSLPTDSLMDFYSSKDRKFGEVCIY
mgnify:CR=1 FL=1